MKCLSGILTTVKNLEMQFTLQVKDAFGRDDIESVNLVMSSNEGATTIFNEEFEDDDLILDNNGLVGNSPTFLTKE